MPKEEIDLEETARAMPMTGWAGGESESKNFRFQIDIQGIVQGVGFRPFVYNLAKRYNLVGFVFNDTRGVHVEAEGALHALESFLKALEVPPRLAAIESIQIRKDLPLMKFSKFEIRESAATHEKNALLSPDVSTCDDCLDELFDPTNRRFLYPFINCTNCGPRYTIIQDIPYDRAKTTMSRFRMCADCEAEYHDPENRRFHAQPNACPDCGPQISLDSFVRNEAILEAVRQIKEGRIVAIKGLGGFHLACDALNGSAVDLLRSRKYREDKPFALMARAVEMIRSFCEVSPAEESLLTSRRRPIVLLRKKDTCSIPESVSPKLKNLGFMLPYTPLHHVLLSHFDTPLVMTSGNVSDEPISYLDQDGFSRLSQIADCFLTHDREIFTRCDDSVTRVFQDREYILRRSRGYVPEPLSYPSGFSKQILACGAELKNTFCLARGTRVFMSHHVGDLENLETMKSFQEGIEHFKRVFYLEPEVVAYDLHPEYLSTKYALDLESIPNKIGVQHHHAHIASCMADNGISGDVIGVAMDGLGFGTDGKFWGCEFMVANLEDFERFSHLRYVPMPGGAKAVKEPWRMGAAYLHQVYGLPRAAELKLFDRIEPQTRSTVQKMLSQNVNCPETSSMGRCFDAVAGLIGIRDRIHYEGEAAIELEMIADEGCRESYHFGQSVDGSTIEITPVVSGVVSDLLAKIPAGIISAKFHNAVVELIVNTASRIRTIKEINRIVLSGGVFQNMLVLDRTCKLLDAEKFDVYTHHRVPANDGGISFGQAVVADARIKAGRI